MEGRFSVFGLLICFECDESFHSAAVDSRLASGRTELSHIL